MTIFETIVEAVNGPSETVVIPRVLLMALCLVVHPRRDLAEASMAFLESEGSDADIEAFAKAVADD